MPGPLRPGYGRYAGVDELPPVSFALSGGWNVAKRVRDRGARRPDRGARDRAQGVPRPELEGRAAGATCEVLLDGRPVAAAEAGADVRDGRVTVREAAPLPAGVAAPAWRTAA